MTDRLLDPTQPDTIEPVTIQQQIDEVHLVIVNRRAWLDRRAELQAQGKSVPPDTGCTAASIPGLEAAVRTLTWIRDNRESVYAAHLGKHIRPSGGEAA